MKDFLVYIKIRLLITQVWIMFMQKDMNLWYLQLLINIEATNWNRSPSIQLLSLPNAQTACWAIGLISRVFANGPGDRGSVSSWVLPKTQKKWYLRPPCLTLSIIRYGSRVKWSNPGNGVTPSPSPQCSSYWKGSLRVTLD